jgi:hypothetical protein
MMAARTLVNGKSIAYDGKSMNAIQGAAMATDEKFEDMAKADGLSGKLPFTFSNVRGTNEADGFGVYGATRPRPVSSDTARRLWACSGSRPQLSRYPVRRLACSASTIGAWA